MEENSKAEMIGMSVVLLVIGLVAGYVIGKNTVSNPIVSKTPTANRAATINWKTYQDPESYYAIQYPSQYQIYPLDLDDGSHGLEIKNGLEFDILININPNTDIAFLDAYVADLSKQYEKDAQNSAAGVNFSTE